MCLPSSRRLLALQQSVTDDPQLLTLLAPYTISGIGYEIPWTYALRRLNQDQTSGQDRGASANGNGFRDRACSW